MLISLIERNMKIFFRDKMLVFFSLLSVFISIILFIFFLEQQQIRSLGNVLSVTPATKLLVTEWMIAGILAMTAMTSTLAVYSLFIYDKESRRTSDFLTTTGSHANILLSYTISAFVIGFILSIIGYIICTVYMLTLGASFPSMMEIAKVIGIMAMGVLLSAMINLFIVLIVKSAKAFSTVNSLVGTLIGFLCAVYIPIGVLPSTMQFVIQAFPVSHIAVLLRQVMMDHSLQTVFASAQTEMQQYMQFYGVFYEINGTSLSALQSIIYIASAIACLGLLSAWLFRMQNK